MQEQTTNWVEAWPEQTSPTFEKILAYAEKMHGFQPDRRQGLSLSFSQLSMWKACGYKWQAMYRDRGPKQAPGLPLTLGTAYHNTCQALALQLEETGEIGSDEQWSLRLEEELFKAHEENLKQGRAYQDDDLVSSYNSLWQAYKAFELAYPGLKGKDTILIDTELYIWQELKKRLFFEGKLDFVFYNVPTDQVIIWDLKTANKAWSADDKRNQDKQLQLLLYKRLLAKALDISEQKILVHFVVCSFDGLVEPVSFKQDEATVDWAWQEAMQLVVNGFTLEDGWKTVRADGQLKTKKKQECGWCHLKKLAFCPGI